RTPTLVSGPSAFTTKTFVDIGLCKKLRPRCRARQRCPDLDSASSAQGPSVARTVRKYKGLRWCCQIGPAIAFSGGRSLAWLTALRMIQPLSGLAKDSLLD